MITVGSLMPYLGGALLLGGIAVALSRQRELIRRWCAWMVGVPIITAAFWFGRPGAAAVAVVAGVIAAFEYARLARLTMADRAVLATALVGLVLTAWLAPLAGLVSLGATALALFMAVSVADITAAQIGPACAARTCRPCRRANGGAARWWDRRPGWASWPCLASPPCP